jgi:DNA-binding response OmpR family regulator
MTRKHLLIVDDDDDILSSLDWALRDMYDVEFAANGQEALTCMERSCFDGIVLDLMMPVLDGEGFLREYRARGWHTPVLLLSARRDLEDATRTLGVQDCLAKPFGLAELEEKLERLVGDRHTEPPRDAAG